MKGFADDLCANHRGGGRPRLRAGEPSARPAESRRHLTCQESDNSIEGYDKVTAAIGKRYPIFGEQFFRDRIAAQKAPTDRDPDGCQSGGRHRPANGGGVVTAKTPDALEPASPGNSEFFFFERRGSDLPILSWNSGPYRWCRMGDHPRFRRRGFCHPIRCATEVSYRLSGLHPGRPFYRHTAGGAGAIAGFARTDGSFRKTTASRLAGYGRLTSS